MEKQDLEKFLAYISSIWGLLAGITSIFPLANVLFKIIPLPVDAYNKSTEPIAIPLTTLVAVFIIFYSFVQRDQVISNPTRMAKLFFSLGCVSLVIFILLDLFWYPLRERFCPELCDSETDFEMWLVMLIPFYIGFFACVTRAFTILALVEFKRRYMAAESE